LIIDKKEEIIAWNRDKGENMIGKGNYEHTIPFYGKRRPILIDLAQHQDPEREKKYIAIQRVGNTLFGESLVQNLPSGNVHLSGAASVLRNEKGNITGAILCIQDDRERKKWNHWDLWPEGLPMILIIFLAYWLGIRSLFEMDCLWVVF
jgi:hypothetical protein